MMIYQLSVYLSHREELMIKTAAVSCLLLATQAWAGSPPFDITQSTDNSTVTSFNSAECPGDDDRYLRRFDLDVDHDLLATLSVSEVRFAVEEATAMTLTINLYEIANQDPLLMANMNLIGTANLDVSATDDLSAVSTPIAGVIDSGFSDLVVEVVAPDNTQASTFFIGSNAMGQSAPSYLLSAACNYPEPTDLATTNYPDMHIIMSVSGELTGPPDLIFSDGFESTASGQ